MKNILRVACGLRIKNNFWLSLLILGLSVAHCESFGSNPINRIKSIVSNSALDTLQLKNYLDTIRIHELAPHSQFHTDTLLKRYENKPLRREVLKWMMTEKNNDAVERKRSYPERGGHYENKVISHVNIYVLDPFGTEIFDPLKKVGKIDKMLNSIHSTTKEKRIRQQLLFKEGEKVDGELISQTEYLLRKKSSVFDAFIWVRTDTWDTSAVRVDVIVKDVFALGADMSLSTSEVKLGLFNRNLFGYDQDLRVDGYYYSGENSFGMDVKYVLPNLFGTFMDLDTRLYHNYENEYQSIEIRRQLNKKLKWTGGYFTEWGEKFRDIPNLDTSLWLNRNVQDYWLGYANRSQNGPTSVFLMKYSHTQANHMDVLIKPYYTYADKRSLLFSWSFFRERYVKQNYIYRLGRIEDVPIGAGIYVTSGIEHSWVGNRIYMETSWQYSYLLWGGFGRYRIDWNTFYHPKKNAWQQGAVQSSVTYVSPLFYRGNHRFRTLSELNYVGGYNRFEEESLRFSDENHARGVNEGNLYGQQRLLLYNELDWYMPYQFIGFKMAGFMNLDMGWIGERSVFSNRPQMAIGCGLRIRNDNLVFSTFQIRLAYYPFMSPGSSGRVLQFSGQEAVNLTDFYPKKPEIFEYK